MNNYYTNMWSCKFACSTWTVFMLFVVQFVYDFYYNIPSRILYGTWCNFIKIVTKTHKFICILWIHSVQPTPLYETPIYCLTCRQWWNIHTDMNTKCSDILINYCSLSTLINMTMHKIDGIYLIKTI